jgi:hypothetical protein
MRVRRPRAAALAATLVGLLVVLAASAPVAGAAPVIGVGEQRGQIFSDPPWAELGLRDTRLVVSWDVTSVPFERADGDGYLAAAKAAGVRVMVTFGHSRARSRAKQLPSVARYRRAFRAFRRRWPEVRTFVAWNEANHCSQPTCHRPERAAAYFDAIRSACPRCTVVAADVLDSKRMAPWLRAFRRAARHRPRIWGLHNYIDANRFRTSGTRELLRTVPGDIWFTETGGLVERNNGSTVPLPDSEAHAAEATDWLFGRLVKLSRRIKRVYVYHWRPAPEPFPTWDSALLDREGRPRLAYDVLRTWVRRAQRARGER